MSWKDSPFAGKPIQRGGKNSSKYMPDDSGSKVIRYAALAFVAVAACIVAVVVLSSSNEDVEEVVAEKKERGRIKKARPAKAAIPEKKEEKKPEPLSWKEELRAKLKGMTPEERMDYAFKMIQERKLDLTPTTNTPFRTGLELSMARIFMTRVGDPPPPLHTTFLPIHDEAHLAEILIAKNPVLDGDSDEVKEAKATVEIVKKEMIAYIKDGGDPETFMAHYHNKLQSAFQERRDSLKEIARVAIEEPEIAQGFYDAVNKKLESKGIARIELTEKQKERLGLE